MIRSILSRIPPLEAGIFIIAIAIFTAVTLGEQAHQAPPEALDSYSSYDYDAGGYRALYELLQREGYRVDRFEQHAGELDADVATLVYSEPLPFDPRQIPSTDSDAHDLERWVRAGGTFVYFGHDDGAAKEKILAQPYSRDASKATGPRLLAPALQAGGVVSLGQVLGGLRFTAADRKDGPGTRVLRKARVAAAASGARVHFRTLFDDGRGPVTITYPFGKGTVVETIDEKFLDNGHLSTGDRARFALALMSFGAKDRTVWFYETVHGNLAPLHWYDLVPRSFIYALAAATIVMLIAIAGSSIRLGPPIVPVPRNDRTSADFIEALSTLLERGKASRPVLEDAVRSTTRAVARSAGLAGDPTTEEIASRIDDEGRRAAFVSMIAGANMTTVDQQTFVRTVALAQRLRKESVSHGR